MKMKIIHAHDGWAMPRAMGAELRAQIALEDREQLQLERSPWNNTGFVGVTKGRQQVQYHKGVSLCT